MAVTSKPASWKAFTSYPEPHPEMIAQAVQNWLKSRSIQVLYIKPGSPWENAYIESFHDKLRDGCLNREMFIPLTEAAVIIDQ